MKTLKIISFLICLSLTFSALAQRNDVLLTNSEVLSENRYEDIEGSPFLFKDWQKGIIHPKNDQAPIEEVLLNYNRHTESFEIKKGNHYISLDEAWYTKVEVLIAKEEAWTFETGLLPKKKQHFDRLIYQGIDFQIVEVFFTNIITREKERYAETIEIKSFSNKSHAYFVQNGKSKLIKLKKKSILALFPDHNSVLEKFAKENKLKFSKTNDLVKILAHYDQNLMPIATKKIAYNHN